ncbi:phosphatase 2C-like domain-containing protein [Naematelia encephala]|uniref:Protein phosphatase n=1 Tax=Naematelia encephala TaxID=71784 RepID=A0A1Y2B559_9TREE|nr:phosphatase 2C-like domain-containing protein [Naematelia encephala]
MRISLSLLQRSSGPSSHSFSSHNHATYAIGLSYASKSSPPFVAPNSSPKRYGFAKHKTPIGHWVDYALSQPAGRGILSGGEPGGWGEEIRKEVERWGAGEDFFCIVDQQRTDESIAQSIKDQHVHLALSDGVGGWGDTVDPSLFSQSLMYHYALSATDSPSRTPIENLKKAYEGVTKDQGVPAGGGTGVGVRLGSDGEMLGVNMGDSGCLVVRNNTVLYETPSMTHYFNCPYQLSKIPPSMASGGMITDSLDDPKTYMKFSINLIPGDVILLYTDGLSDNVPIPHLTSLLTQIDALLSHPSNSHLGYIDRQKERARLFADVLVGYGRMAMAKTGQEDGVAAWKTPFQIEAAKHGYDFRGGKIDDITVVTAVVGERYPEED